MDTFVEVLKWIGVALAAGFVGYFGRYLAKLVIEKVRGRRSRPDATPEPPEAPPASPEVQLEESRLKLEKKRTKAEAKRVKKAKDE